MEQDNKKKVLWWGIVLAVVVILLVVWAVMAGRKNMSSSGAAATAGGGGPAGAIGSNSSSSGSGTYAPAPANVVVPNVGATSTGGVAVPVTETPAAPGVSAKYRSFNITVNSSGFSPATIAVNVGDTVNLQITASGGNYYFTQPDLGFNDPLPEGQTKTVSFSPMTAGKYLFYCSSCGGPTKGPTGYIIVAAQ
jgi:heme/copper-type cytochrome/quinol oxidase subunit 2